MIGRLMTFLGLGLLATIVPPNEPKCVLGIILYSLDLLELSARPVTDRLLCYGELKQAWILKVG